MVFWYKVCVIGLEMTLEFNRFYFVFRIILQNVPNRSHLPWSVSPGSIQNSLRMRDGKDTETLCLDVLGGSVRNPSNIGFGDVPYALVYSIYPFVFCKFHSFPKCNRSHTVAQAERQWMPIKVPSYQRPVLWKLTPHAFLDTVAGKSTISGKSSGKCCWHNESHNQEKIGKMHLPLNREQASTTRRPPSLHNTGEYMF